MISTSHPKQRDMFYVLRLSGFALCLLTLSAHSSFSQDSRLTDTTTKRVTSAPAIDWTELRIAGGPCEKGVGWLKYGGYQGRGAKGIHSTYHSVDNTMEVEVEVTVHPAEYRYVSHDFYGAFRATVEYLKVQSGEPEQVSRFLDWTQAGGHRSGVICASLYSDPRRGKNSYIGVVGWYHLAEENMTTVVMKFSHLSGFPGKLIESHLAKFPSSVVSDDPQYTNWQANDIEKWINLLQAKEQDGAFLDSATTYFMQHYEKRAFGLLEGGPWRSRGSQECIDATRKAIDKMKGWLERDTKTREMKDD
jgi:hypothetical protein